MQVNQCLGAIAFASFYFMWSAANLCDTLKAKPYGPGGTGNSDSICEDVSMPSLRPLGRAPVWAYRFDSTPRHAS